MVFIEVVIHYGMVQATKGNYKFFEKVMDMGARSPTIVLNGRTVELADVPGTRTLLDWLRGNQRLVGTKEGCAEGDCGACTVVLEDYDGERVRRRAINACLTTVGQVASRGIRTVEGLLRDGALHPVQQAFAASGGTQCGFCTPGFVMSAFAYVAEGGSADRSAIHDVLAGNLCRCTGYRPIVSAVVEAIGQPGDFGSEEEARLGKELRDAKAEQSASFTDADGEFYVPRTLNEALALRQRFQDANILAGGTDLNLAVSQRREKLPRVIYLGDVDELKVCTETADEIVVGAAATYELATGILVRAFPQLQTYLSRFGSVQIRNLGTIGGNIGTASPIGDVLPVLLALSARIRLNSTIAGRREVAAESYFVAYRRTALRPDELIEAIILPKLREGCSLYVDKVSKRRDQDISTISSAFLLGRTRGKIDHVRLAFGGMAPVPKRATRAEAVLLGRGVNEAVFAAAAETLAEEFDPLTDWRGSRDYRLAVAKSLMLRTCLRMLHEDSSSSRPPLELDRL